MLIVVRMAVSTLERLSSFICDDGTGDEWQRAT
jgi:hypothetical protein